MSSYQQLFSPQGNYTPWQQYQSYAQGAPDPTRFTSAYRTLLSQTAPEMAGLDNSDILAQQRYNLGGQSNLLNAQDLQGQIANQQRDLAARQGGLAAEQGAQARQGEFIGRQYNLAMQTLENQRQAGHAAYDTGLRSLYSDAAARGATQTFGTRAGRSDLYGQLQRAMKDVRIGRGEAGLTRDRGLTDALNAKAQLDMRAKQYGIEGDELQRRLNNGLAQLGAGRQLDALDLMDALSSNDVKRREAAQQVWNQVIQASIANPTQFSRPQTSPSLGHQVM
jgi:hypothetical protein